jgi:hypothetical protein
MKRKIVSCRSTTLFILTEDKYSSYPRNEQAASNFRNHSSAAQEGFDA